MVVEVSEQDLKKILQKIPKFHGEYLNFEIRAMSDEILGFLADHYILRIVTSTGYVDLFLKVYPRNIQKRMEYLTQFGAFLKELKFYEHFVPKLKEITAISWNAECYLTKESHFIVLENLEGFKIIQLKGSVLDYEHCKVAMKTLASFHASSLIYEEKFKKFSREDLEILKENSHPRDKNHVRAKGLETCIKVLMELIKRIPKYKGKSEIYEKFPKVMARISDFVQPSKKYKNVLAHGDLWTNNLMFKYDAQNKPKECKLVDFQLIRYAPLATDLTTLIYTSTTKNLREKCLSEILNIYCESLDAEFKIYGIQPVTKDEVLKSFKEFKLCGLIEAALFCHLTLLPTNLASNILKSSEEYEKFINQCRIEKCLKAFEVDHYRERMTEILSEIVDEFVLK